MKKTGFIITILFVAVMLTAPIYASDINDKITSSITDELSGFENALPDNIKDAKYYEYGDNKTEQAAKKYWDLIKE